MRNDGHESSSGNVQSIRMFLQIPFGNYRLTLRQFPILSCTLVGYSEHALKTLHFVVCTVTAPGAHTSKAPFHTFNYLLHGAAAPVFKG